MLPLPPGGSPAEFGLIRFGGALASQSEERKAPLNAAGGWLARRLPRVGADFVHEKEPNPFCTPWTWTAPGPTKTKTKKIRKKRVMLTLVSILGNSFSERETGVRASGMLRPDVMYK